AAAHAAEPSGTKSAAAATRASTTPAKVAALHFFAEGESFAEAEVGAELVEAGPIIDGDDLFADARNGVKVAPLGADDVGGIGKTRGEGRSVIENGIAVQILSHRNVEGRGGIRNDKGRELNSVRQIPTASHEEAVTHIVGSASVVLFQIILVHREAAAAGCVAVNIAEGIEAEERKLGTPNVEIADQLILVVKAGGFVLIQVGDGGIGPCVVGIRRVGC